MNPCAPGGDQSLHILNSRIDYFVEKSGNPGFEQHQITITEKYLMVYIYIYT